MSYKSIDSLMRHLRDSGITINGSKEKIQLTNNGYFHGYKGYRFFNNPNNKIPFTSYEEVQAIIDYDSDIKELLYRKIMFIETAIKNIALVSILNKTKSENINDVFDRAVSSYKNAPASSTPIERTAFQEKKLVLQNRVQAALATAYRKKNPKITHYYNNMTSNDIPIWAFFEIISMGDLGSFLSALTIDVREDISRRLKINLAFDTNRTIVSSIVYTLKQLRNAVAHNLVVFDARFQDTRPNNAIIQCLKSETGLPYINFKTIGDYIILIDFCLKHLNVSKTERKKFIRDFQKITLNLKETVSPAVFNMIVRSDLMIRLDKIKNL